MPVKCSHPICKYMSESVVHLTKSKWPRNNGKLGITPYVTRAPPLPSLFLPSIPATTHRKPPDKDLTRTDIRPDRRNNWNCSDPESGKVADRCGVACRLEAVLVSIARLEYTSSYVDHPQQYLPHVNSCLTLIDRCPSHRPSLDVPAEPPSLFW